MKFEKPLSFVNTKCPLYSFYVPEILLQITEGFYLIMLDSNQQNSYKSFSLIDF